ncbi:MAG: Gfo/Idh/MocA family oxidoreductase [Acidimicrobiia bacterium]
MNAEPVRFALVGFGSGGRYFHAPLLTSADNIDLVGVVTTSPERRALVASELPGVRVFDSIEAAVGAGAEAAAISTPVHTHSALTDEALGRGLHVVCDKPFALDADAAAESVRVAARCDRLLSPYQNRRWDSDFLTVQQLVADGRLGAVRRFESRFERFAPQRGPGPAGGGTLLDFLSHLVDQALVLLGPVRSVYAEWVVRDTGRDDDVFAALTHANGARSHLWGSWSQTAPGPRFRVTGTEAAYVVTPTMDGQEAALIAGESPRSLGDAWGVEPEERWGELRRGTEPVEVVPTLPGAWGAFYPAFANAVRGTAPVPVVATDAVETARVLDAARRSATEGAVVELAPRR